MNDQSAKLSIVGIWGILREFAFIVAGAAALFGAAGTLRWPRGWIYIALAALYQAVYVSMLLKINPQLLNERGNLNWKETKPHDRYFTVFYPLLAFAALVVSGLDAVRYGWSHVPFVAVYPAAVVFICASFVALWAYACNSYFILTHRNDAVASQRVCTAGPYRYVRHPAYLAGIATAICYPFLTGSLVSAVPMLSIILLLVVRTRFEDMALQEELQGYEEYARETRYRLLPHVW
ncbi:MAG: isoprenylcysteine carboxylmethyltransferase family protein [Spirochaetes bacterium]|nr:isoprenylcysteine carboxylmethyltransferase family protein [Spirochaetota bacterium]